MYKSPITLYTKELETAIENDIIKTVQRYGITVDKGELIKALQYDRNQYNQGYKDGYSTAEGNRERCNICRDYDNFAEIVCYNGETGKDIPINYCPNCGAKNNLDVEKTIEENKYAVDWNNVAVDTPIQVLVSKYDDVWENAHFAKYEDGIVFFWEDGMTSWTTEETTWRPEKLVKLIVERKDV